MGVFFRRCNIMTRTCPICCAKDETIIYFFFECKSAVEIWGRIKFMDVIMDAPLSSFVERFAWIAGKINKDKLREFATLAWTSLVLQQ